MSSQWSFSFSTGGAGRKETISDMNSGANAAGRSSSITTHEITLPKGNISEVSGNFSMPDHVESINIKQVGNKYLAKVEDYGNTVKKSW